MKFEPRTTAPSKTNKYYLKAGKGGYNRAIEIDEKTHSCLPNCCGLVHGRWLESQKQTDYNKYDKLCTGNAKSYYNKKDGYKRSKTPELGAIGCYSGGSDGFGHVLFVEEIKSNGDIVTSNSAYGGSRFYLKTLTKKSGYKYNDKYKLQGFILPDITFNDDEPKDDDLQKQLDEANAKINELTLEVDKQQVVIDKLNADKQELQNEINSYKEIYQCTKDGNYNIKIKLYNDECLYIK